LKKIKNNLFKNYHRKLQEKEVKNILSQIPINFEKVKKEGLDKEILE